MLASVACDQDYTFRASVHVTAAGAAIAGALVVPLGGMRYREGGEAQRTGADGKAVWTMTAFNHVPSHDPFVVHVPGYPLRVVMNGRDYVSSPRGCASRTTTTASFEVDLSKTVDLHAPLHCGPTSCEVTFAGVVGATCDAYLVQIAPGGTDATVEEGEMLRPVAAGAGLFKLEHALPKAPRAGGVAGHDRDVRLHRDGRGPGSARRHRRSVRLSHPTTLLWPTWNAE